MARHGGRTRVVRQAGVGSVVGISAEEQAPNSSVGPPRAACARQHAAVRAGPHVACTCCACMRSMRLAAVARMISEACRIESKGNVADFTGSFSTCAAASPSGFRGGSPRLSMYRSMSGSEVERSSPRRKSAAGFLIVPKLVRASIDDAGRARATSRQIRFT